MSDIIDVGVLITPKSTSKLKSFNKNYKGLGTICRKRKETRGDTDGTIIQFLYPLIFDTKIPRD